MIRRELARDGFPWLLSSGLSGIQSEIPVIVVGLD